MDIKFEYEKTMDDIEAMLKKIPESLQDGERKLLRDMGKSVKKNVESNLSYSDVEEKAKKIKPSNYDGSIPYVHMKDEVESSVRKTKDGDLYVVVRGGKMTGYKWHFLNDGTVNMAGTNFIEKAMIDSETEINRLIDEMIQKAL